ISHSLLSLDNLAHLDLSMNYLSDSSGRKPEFLSSMTNLRYLNLSGIPFSGRVPPHLGNLSQLQYLDLSEGVADLSCNENMGMNRMMTTSLMKLCNLTVLDLSMYNNITGNMPGQMAHLTSLVVLDISYNNLTEAIPPGVAQLASLSILDLSGNNLSGHMPFEIGMLANLSILDLSGNNLSGHVPSEIGLLANLAVLVLSSNKLNGDITEKHSARLAKLKQLHLSIKSLNIRVSSEWLPPFSLKWVSLQYCQRGPQFPAWLRFQHMLDLALNSLSGNLPSKLGTPQLTSLTLFSNHITGGLSGSIFELQSLKGLDLGNNLFNGELPRCVPPRTLRFLRLSNNSFSGDFPLFLQNSMQLEVLDLSRNRLSGKLPHWIGGLVGLRFLSLSQNTFSGNIPNSITNLTNLHHLELANNRLSDVIPWGLSSLTAMTEKYVKDLSFQIGEYYMFSEDTREYFSSVTKGQELYYDIRIFEMVSIDLSFNHLSGEIPEEMASLNALLNLNLSWNHLRGEVPEKIGLMKSLESLDLSNNVLSGEIPSSLSNLSYLSYLDLSDNNLTGRAPSGQQLDTLYAEHPSMYSGNSGLCGPPILKMCPGNNASRQDVQNRNEHGFEPMKFYFGLGLGFMLGLWVAFCILSFKKAWRIAYFRLIDSIHDQIYVFVIVTRKSLAREGSTD
ncbi:hypothetical protein SETIT_8G153600v2, partial [Setaria italica]